MAAKLHVNIDHVATLRQQRDTTYPDPVWAAALAELAGADGITLHLREDRRHIQERDAVLLRESTRGVVNLEMAATPAMLEFAARLKPDVVTLVPEKREERTTEGGLALDRDRKVLQTTIEALQKESIPVSLFIDPELQAIEQAAGLGVDRIELHTGRYCENYHPLRVQGWLPYWQELAGAAEAAAQLKLHVAAGHGLDYLNLAEVCRIPAITEFNIGHCIVARAVMVGMQAAVQEILCILRQHASAA